MLPPKSGSAPFSALHVKTPRAIAFDSNKRTLRFISAEKDAVKISFEIR
jgi:hypothetical protein